MNDVVARPLLAALVIAPLGPWVREAACAGRAAAFTSKPATRREAAELAATCARCAVLAHCAEQVKRERFVTGTWAGVYRDPDLPRQRRA